MQNDLNIEALKSYALFLEETLSLPKREPKQMAPLALAYLGDAVYELLIRTTVVLKKDVSSQKLNKYGVSFANAKTQAKFIDTFYEELTEDEITFVKKGKNAKVGTIPKSCTPHEYHLATGFECMFGYLFLCGQIDRLIVLFSKVLSLVEME